MAMNAMYVLLHTHVVLRKWWDDDEANGGGEERGSRHTLGGHFFGPRRLASEPLNDSQGGCTEKLGGSGEKRSTKGARGDRPDRRPIV